MKRILTSTIYVLGVSLTLWLASLPMFDESYPRQWGSFYCTCYVIVMFAIGLIFTSYMEMYELNRIKKTIK